MKRSIIKTAVSVIIATMAVGTFTGCRLVPREDDDLAGIFETTETSETFREDRKEPGSAYEDRPYAAETESADGTEIIKVFGYNEDIETLCYEYSKVHDTDEYLFVPYVIPEWNGAYQESLDRLLTGNGDESVDIFMAADTLATRYTKGVMAEYVADYSDIVGGLEMLDMIDYSQYLIDIGTGKDGSIKGLGYDSEAGMMIYRADIAEKVFGTDDPNVIADLFDLENNPDKYWESIETLKENGYAFVSSTEDVWRLYDGSTGSSWITDGEFNVSSEREEYLDAAKRLYENGYTNEATMWDTSWQDDMKGLGDREVFCFFGPSWLLYTMDNNIGKDSELIGMYRVCRAPAPYVWGGSLLMASERVLSYDIGKRKAISDFLYWTSLDPLGTGFQYKAADEDLFGYDINVAIADVNKRADHSSALINYQSTADVYNEADKTARGTYITEYDDRFSAIWLNKASAYVRDEISREEVMEAVKAEYDAIMAGY